jgi:uncharacterized protein (TIGR03435 family)
MVRSALPVLLVAALASPLGGQSPEFEVASIKRNTSATPMPTSGPPPSPSTGQITLSWIAARFLTTRAYPDLTTPFIVEGLPAWADSERWDVVAKFRPGATAEEQAQMWKTLLADRMKLQAHYETKPRSGYRLVLARADQRLGPQMTPVTITCPPADSTTAAPAPTAVREIAMAVLTQRRAPTAQEEATLMSQCSSMGIGDRLYAGSLDMKGLTQSLQFLARLDGPITDATGLEGRFAIKLWAARAAVAPVTAAPGAAVEPNVDDAPSLFSALQDQLGLKLERTTVDGKVLVVDHIERPTEN